MAKHIIVHLRRVAGDRQDYLSSGIHLDAENEDLGVLQELVTDALSAVSGCLSGWNVLDDDWVSIPVSSIEAVTITGFERPEQHVLPTGVSWRD